MLDKLTLSNNHSKIEETYSASLAYLESHPDLYRAIATHIMAYREIGDLIPQTPENFWSGHFFPYSEALYELENSYELALQGFYNYAFIALRSVLELGLLGVYFAVHDTEYIDVRPWIISKKRTPRRQDIFTRLRKMETFRAFDSRFGLEKRILKIFDVLDGFVHTRGYRYSSSALTLANFNQFSEKSLRLYCNTMFGVVANLMIIILLKYPVGMQGLPLDEKFGLNGPIGGFLREGQVRLITSLIDPEEREFLQKLSDEDPTVQSIVEYFTNLPDITDEELQRQIMEFDNFLKMNSRSDEDAG